MKKIIVVLLIAFLALPGYSQIKFGIKAGAATTTVPTYNFNTGSTNIDAVKEAGWGFQAGIFVRLSLLGIYLQPEAVFASNSYDFNVTEGTNPVELVKQTFNRLEVPVMVGVKLGPIRINVGPAASVQIGSPKALINDPNFEDLYRGATFGYQAGIGFDLFKKLTFDARYGGSLSQKFGDSVTIGSQTFNLDSRQPSFILSVGLMF
jgi:hypothetical protein